MSTLAGVHYDGCLPLDLRVRREEKVEEHFSGKVTSHPKSSRKQRTELLITAESFIQVGIVKKEKDLECFGLTANQSGSFEFQTVGDRGSRPEYIATDVTDDLRKVAVKEEPQETDESIENLFNSTEEPLPLIEPLFSSTEESLPLRDDLAYLTKIEEDHSSEEDALIIDFNFERASRGRRSLNRSNSNCSTNSNSSGASESYEEVKAFVMRYAREDVYRNHQCTKCKMNFEDLHSLFMHLDVHSSRNPNEKCMRCPACLRMFQKYKALAAHIRKIHLGPMDHNCRFCHKPFKYQLHVQKHEPRCKKKRFMIKPL